MKPFPSVSNTLGTFIVVNWNFYQNKHLMIVMTYCDKNYLLVLQLEAFTATMINALPINIDISKFKQCKNSIWIKIMKLIYLTYDSNIFEISNLYLSIYLLSLINTRASIIFVNFLCTQNVEINCEGKNVYFNNFIENMCSSFFLFNITIPLLRSS